MEHLEQTFLLFKDLLEKEEAERKELKEIIKEWEGRNRSLSALLLKVHHAYSTRSTT